jgi:CheY-like chemotaxis protein
VKALLVDDDATTRFMLKHALARETGWEAVEAADGVDALRVLETEAVDLVFLDVKMPRMDGLDMLRTLRRTVRHGRVPVVMLTGANEEHIVRQVLRLGVIDYLLKPLTEDTLQTRLGRLLAAVDTTAEDVR